MMHVSRLIKPGLALFVLFCLGACDPGRVDYEEQVALTPTAGRDYGDVNALVQTAYRIDISEISLRLDYHPRAFYAEAQAEIRFQTYRDQTRPIIHLDPVLTHPERLTGLELDGEALDPARDWRVVDGIDSNQQALEIQRVLNWKEPHTLRLRYRIELSRSYYMLNSRVSDLYGRSNEEFFPTINRFGDLIRHRIDFYVHGDMPFRCLGSGRITPLTADGLSAWRLDTLREVPSNTVMFVLVPAEDTVEETRLVDGVSVRIAAFQGGASITQAFGILTPWLAELRQNFGPFPMPEGFQVFLMQDGGGMEYYGGTISSLGALAHETFHMYFGTSLVLSTYRDSWIDEAVNEWYELSALNAIGPIPDSYRSNMVSGRSPAGIGFDRRAYTDGAQIMEHIAHALGGRSAMIGFLSRLIQTKTLLPFSTRDFLAYLRNDSGLDYETPFENWVFSGEDISAGGAGLHRDVETKHRVVIVPPASVMKRYPELSDGDET